MAVSRTPLEIAQDLQHKTHLFTQVCMSPRDAEELGLVLGRLLEFEKTRQQNLSYQHEYNTKKYQDPDYAAKKKAQNIARDAERYKNDPEFRSRRLQQQRKAYQKKKQNFAEALQIS